MDYSTLSTDELLKMKKAVDELLNERDKEEKNKALKKAIALAREFNNLCDKYGLRFDVVSEDEYCITQYLDECVEITNIYLNLDED